MRGLLMAALIAAPGVALAQDGHEMCFMSAVTVMLPAPDDALTTEDCIAACQANTDCVAWTYRPHGFAAGEMPGTCRLMPDVFETTVSDSAFCGRIGR